MSEPSWVYIGREPYEPLGLSAFSEVIPRPSTLRALAPISGLLLTKADFRIWLKKQLVHDLSELCRTYGMDSTNPRDSFRVRTNTAPDEHDRGNTRESVAPGPSPNSRAVRAAGLAKEGKSWAGIARLLKCSAPTAKKLAISGGFSK